MKRGQTIGVCAPAGPVDLERLQRGLACLGDTFSIRIADSMFRERSPTVPSYLAASDDERVAELDAMLRDPDIRA
ncbi:MAG TPA: LD-carboxypeptidase, partial [Kofleriaceae bacterium]|nr:LD-carboxypeptidase [Kofleriaceae bacterium]